MQMEPTLTPDEHKDPKQTSAEEAIPQTEPALDPNEKAATETKEPQKKEDTRIEIQIDQLRLEDFPVTLEKIIKHDQWMKHGQLVRDLQQAFDSQFLVLIQEKKEAFIAEGGNEIDFFFAPDYKKVLANSSKNIKQERVHISKK